MSKVIAAGIFIMRNDGKLLICHPWYHPEDVWSIPKGKVEKGETKLEAALRETEEETNLWLGSNDNFIVYDLEHKTYGHKKKVLYPFLFLEMQTSTMDWVSLEIKCNSNVPEERGGFPEMDDFKWVGIDEAREVLHETQIACLDNIQLIAVDKILKDLEDETGLTRS
jgi:8-oxo-dGTP pyrophosphatase MutT (NUDIX family)